MISTESQSSVDDDHIDNSRRTYVEVSLSCGVLAMVSPQAMVDCPDILRILDIDLQECLHVLPRSVHGLVRRTKVWVNHTYAYGNKTDPNFLNHTTFHHSETWLVVVAKDSRDKSGGIEIYNCSEFESSRLHWNGCGLILHEITHAVHQFVVADGIANERILQGYHICQASKKYDLVLRRDWAGCSSDSDMAYAMVNHKEFFAELSVAFLSTRYNHLGCRVDGRLESLSPPIVHPVVYNRVREESGDAGGQKFCCCFVCWRCLRPGHTRLTDERFLRQASHAYCRGIGHCNKFYPFTRTQLKCFDEHVGYALMDTIWRDVGKWVDPFHRRIKVAPLSNRHP